MKEKQNSWKRWLVSIAKWLIFVLVIVAVCYTVMLALAEAKAREFSLAQIDVRWFAATCVLYLVGLAPCWLFWHRVLHAMGQSPTLWETFRAYYISHLGKYVPGKAMVVILRTTWVRSPRTDTTVAAISVFVETLTYVSAAAFVAGLLLCVSVPDNPLLLVIALGLMVCAGLPTIPAVLLRVIRILQVKRINPDVEEALGGLSVRLTLTGWLTISGGWLLIGSTLWTSLHAIPGVQPPLNHLLPVIACMSLSSVVGFFAMIPGGMGVRELVVTEILRNALMYSRFEGIVSAILVRLSLLLSEVAISVMLYSSSYLRRPPDTSSETD